MMRNLEEDEGGGAAGFVKSYKRGVYFNIR